ncbi:MAG: MBL fold metallo-hydrolase [Clostridia bacterium]|nr:MBL fold metallo-hydrolase [Clostridia bacterium]
MTRFCSLVSGSSGNVLYLEHKKTKILIDCGISCKRVADSLQFIGVSPEEIDAILVTHEHADHVCGIRVFSNKFGCKVYSGEKTLENISCGEAVAVESGRVFEIGDVSVTPFAIPHDAVQPMGFAFECGGKKLSVATDMGKIDASVAEAIRGSDFVFIEANHNLEMLKNGPYPFYLKQRILSSEGHMSNDQCASLVAALARTGTKRFVLGHLSNTNNTPELARKTVADCLTEGGFEVGKDVLLDVAKRHSVSEIYEI